MVFVFYRPVPPEGFGDPRGALFSFFYAQGEVARFRSDPTGPKVGPDPGERAELSQSGEGTFFTVVFAESQDAFFNAPMASFVVALPGGSLVSYFLDGEFLPCECKERGLVAF